GVPLTHVTAMLAVNQASGVLGLFAGPLTDRFGFRIAMLIGLAALSTGMLTAGLWPTVFTVLAALFLSGLAKNIFDPAIQAYVGEHVPYHRRGRVIGLIEMSWAGSTLIGIPLMGLVIATYGWQWPFAFLGLLGLIGIVAVGISLPPDRPLRSGVPAVYHLLSQSWRQLAQSRQARAMLMLDFLISMANDGLFVVTGAWLEQQYGLSLAAIGFSTVVIGFSELSGECLTAALADRIGKKHAIMIGLGMATVAYAALPMAGSSLNAALVGLFGLFLSVEFTIVTTFSLATEMLPDRRATMMAGLLAAAGLGRMAGALMGGWLWIAGGLPAVTTSAAILNAVAAIIVTQELHGRRE
ncbi:MAG: MFS transporter, partial [Oceanisphaera sp.]|nr:MFS transporter [Oceanisphaera sp.]